MSLRAWPAGGPSFIAEVASNHGRDLGRCLGFVDRAARAGFDTVKFQLFRVALLFAPEILARSHAHQRREEWELPFELLPEIARRCRERGIRFACTPFDLEAVDRLEEHVDLYKISSYELLWEDLLTSCAGTGKPVLLSTGMAMLPEVEWAVRVLRKAGCRDLTLLHCVSAYPAPAAECNLAAIETLRQRFGCSVGWSDHSACPAVIQRAVHRWGADVVELHLDLDGTGAEFAGGHCWLPDAIEPVIASIRAGIGADGTGEKVPAAAELPDRDWRADPVDGLRPLASLRGEWRG